MTPAGDDLRAAVRAHRVAETRRREAAELEADALKRLVSALHAARRAGEPVNVRAAAESAGVSRQTLHRRLRALERDT